ncbi:MAG TPA: low-specificity L-threonine aldolase [Candidatus Melainabacteria bacterium]|nr:low-specificity L-threonine aldolase [Candidatus Melainabacteria bacterium]
MSVIDLRSDTVTRPTAAMKEAMAQAEVGDDVFGEDPTVNDLEAYSAQLMGKEAGLFVASGTMGNFVSLLSHCGRGDEVLVARGAHIFQYEQGGAFSLGGMELKPIGQSKMQALKASDVLDNISPRDQHKPITRLVCLENTLNGIAVPLETLDAVAEAAVGHNLKTHMDGARIFNAALALKTDVKRLVEKIDSVQFCFSKGLSAPAGSMVVGNREFIDKARRARKVLGGGMRQVGLLAAACRVALEKMTDRLEEDHENARKLAEGVAKLDCLQVDLSICQTNMVWIETNFPGEKLKAQDLVEAVKNLGVLVLATAPDKIRAVTHYGITDGDIDRTIAAFDTAVTTVLEKADIQTGSRS